MSAWTGRLRAFEFALEGHGPLAEAIAGELAPVRTEAADPPAARFVVADRLPDLEGVRLSDVTAGPSGIEYRAGLLRVQVRGAADARTVHVQLAPRRLLGLPPALARLRDWNYLDRTGAAAKDFAYDVFDQVNQLAQLEQGASLVHASSFERDGRAVMLAASGGVGKTTGMLRLVLEDGWRYLSDDIGLVDEEGTVWRTPKRLQVYAYNVAGHGALRGAVLRGRSALDRACWSVHRMLKGAKGVRRRVSAERLLGADRVASSAPLGLAILLERCSASRFEATDATADVLARSAAAIALEELRPLASLCLAAQSVSEPAPLPALRELAERTEYTLRRAFADCRIRRLRVPAGAAPDDLLSALRAELDAR